MSGTQDPLPAATEIRAKTVAVTASAFLVAVAVGSSALGLVFYMREVFRVSASTVGLLAATNSLCYVSGCLLLRPVFRRIRSRYCLLIATGGSAVALTAILLGRSVAVTFVVYALFGFLMAFFWPPLAGWLSHGLESRSLGRATSRFNMSWSLGTIFSAYIAGRLSELDPASPLVFSAALYAGTFTLLVLLALLSPELRRDEYREAAPVRGRAPDSGTPLRFPVRAAAGLGVGGQDLHARLGQVGPVGDSLGVALAHRKGHDRVADHALGGVILPVVGDQAGPLDAVHIGLQR